MRGLISTLALLLALGLGVFAQEARLPDGGPGTTSSRQRLIPNLKPNRKQKLESFGLNLVRLEGTRFLITIEFVVSLDGAVTCLLLDADAGAVSYEETKVVLGRRKQSFTFVSALTRTTNLHLAGDEGDLGTFSVQPSSLEWLNGKYHFWAIALGLVATSTFAFLMNRDRRIKGVVDSAFREVSSLLARSNRLEALVAGPLISAPSSVTARQVPIPATYDLQPDLDQLRYHLKMIEPRPTLQSAIQASLTEPQRREEFVGEQLIRLAAQEWFSGTVERRKELRVQCFRTLRNRPYDPQIVSIRMGTPAHVMHLTPDQKNGQWLSLRLPGTKEYLIAPIFAAVTSKSDQERLADLFKYASGEAPTALAMPTKLIHHVDSTKKWDYYSVARHGALLSASKAVPSASIWDSLVTLTWSDAMLIEDCCQSLEETKAILRDMQERIAALKVSIRDLELQASSTPPIAPVAITRPHKPTFSLPPPPPKTIALPSAQWGLPAGWWMAPCARARVDGDGTYEGYFARASLLHGEIAEALKPLRSDGFLECILAQIVADQESETYSIIPIRVDNNEPVRPAVGDQPERKLAGRELYQIFVTVRDSTGGSGLILIPSGEFSVDQHPTVLFTLIEKAESGRVVVHSMRRPAELVAEANGRFKLPAKGEMLLKIESPSALKMESPPLVARPEVVDPSPAPGTETPLGVKRVPWSDAFAKTKTHNEPKATGMRQYLLSLKQLASLAGGQIIRVQRRDNLIGVVPIADSSQIPVDRRVFLMLVGRLLENGCWEVVPPKGEIPVDSAANALGCLLQAIPARLEVRGVLEPAIWEPKDGAFAIRQYLKLDLSAPID